LEIKTEDYFLDNCLWFFAWIILKNSFLINLTN